jgi:translation initiation factor 4A
MESNLDATIKGWEDIPNIKTELLRGIFAHGFENPSSIQQKAILPILSKKDVIAQAQSGTGKTGAFTISALQSLDPEKKTTQVLIMVPTRELCLQITSVITTIGDFFKDLKIQMLVGGSSVDNDIRELRKNPQVIVGCPGRIHDMIRRNKLNAKDIDLLIIDEADEMLSSGFKEQVYNIFQFFKTDIQIALFSATLPSDVQSLADKFMREPLKILVKSEALTLEGIKQYFIAVESDECKYATLKDLYATLSVGQSIIYCNSIRRVEDLAKAMKEDGFPVAYIHGKMTHEERKESFNNFKHGATRVLISSNLTARGIDVQQVSTVINFDVPRDVHSYLHRIGRSGRWGRKGMGINFVSKFDVRNLKEIETFYSTQIDEMPTSVLEV